MATRARGSSRSRDGLDEAAFQAMGLNEPAPKARSSGTRTRSSSGTQQTRKAPARKPSSGKTGQNRTRSANKRPSASGKGRTGRGRPRTPPPRKSHNPVMILIGWIGLTIASAWMLLAGSVGFAARAVGRGARDLDPHHRRDGLGLLTLGAAIVLAAGLWFRMPNAAGRSIRSVAVGGFGRS